MQTQIDQLKLTKDFQQLIDDLEILSYEREKRIKTLQFETEEIEGKRRTRSQNDELANLKEQKKLLLEIARLDSEIEKIKHPLKVPTEPTPEQKRAQEKAACEARIADLKAQKKLALRIDDEEERILKVNALDDALQREYERWTKLV